MKCVLFLKKILNVFQKNDKKPVLIPDFIFFSSEDFKNGNKIQKSFKEFSGNFFLFTVEKKKKKLGLETVEHTASTILVVQIVTKNEKTLSIPYWSFGCLQTTWISVGAVFSYLFYFFIFVPT